MFDSIRKLTTGCLHFDTYMRGRKNGAPEENPRGKEEPTRLIVKSQGTANTWDHASANCAFP